MTADETGGPWWASGGRADQGIDDQDPFGAHQQARRGGPDDDPAAASGDEAAGQQPGDDLGALAGEAVDLLARLATEAARRFGRTGGDPDRAAPRTEEDLVGPHPDGSVCDACPVCIGLRAVQRARPDVVTHLSEAAHHVTLAMQAFADAQARSDEGLQHIDIDP